jgi:hypothetical protein
MSAIGRSRYGIALVVALSALYTGPTAIAQGAAPTDLVGTQQAAMAPLAGFNGLWRGEAWSLIDGERASRTVTVRVGMALAGATQFMEIRSFDRAEALVFHALNNVAFKAEEARYLIQARAEGRFGAFPFRPTSDGYVWELIFDGRGLRYTGTLRDGIWKEVTERVTPDRAPEAIAEFSIQRIGDTDWPAGGAMQP